MRPLPVRRRPWSAHQVGHRLGGLSPVAARPRGAVRRRCDGQRLGVRDRGGLLSRGHAIDRPSGRNRTTAPRRRFTSPFLLVRELTRQSARRARNILSSPCPRQHRDIGRLLVRQAEHLPRGGRPAGVPPRPVERLEDPREPSGSATLLEAISSSTARQPATAAERQSVAQFRTMLNSHDPKLPVPQKPRGFGRRGGRPPG